MAGAALWTCPSSFFVAGAAFQTCRLASFLRIALAGVREVVTKCKLRGRRGILRDVMTFGRGLARNIDFEVANFQLLVKTRRKTSIFDLQLVKIADSRTNCVFWCFHVCPCVSLAAPCLSGSCKTFRLRRCPNVKIGGSLA